MIMVTIKDNKKHEAIKLIVGDSGERIDLYVCKYTDLNRSRVQKLIKDGLVAVNNIPVKANYKVKENDEVSVKIPPVEELKIMPEKISLEVIYEDADLIVINKPKGLVVHPAAGNYSGTLVNALLEHCGESLSGINGVIRPGIVHRIDKDTTGLLVVAKNDLAHISLAEQIKNKSVAREYLALVHGVIQESKGLVDAPISRHPVQRKKMAVTEKGKSAVTHYQVMERFSQYTLVKARLETGRTHQIRVHMAYVGHPVVGDPVYGPKKAHFGLDGQLLHAFRLGFVHPRHKKYQEFTSQMPNIFANILTQLEPTKIT